MACSKRVIHGTAIAALGVAVAAVALASVRPSPHPAEFLPAHTIRVRLAEGLPQVSLRGFDLELNDGQLKKTLDRTSDWMLTCEGSRVTAVLKTDAKPLVFRSPLRVQSPAGFLTFNGKPYRDAFVIRSVARAGSVQSCEVVNEVDIEKYLDGLVNSEFSASWAEEAIAAQVVAARTYALFQANRARERKDSTFDLDASVKDQVYDGSFREDYRASRSVGRTRGLILVDPKEKGEPKPVKAFYHSTCGGKTELPQHVWGARHVGFRRTVACAFCDKSPRFRWKLEVSARDLADAYLKGAKADSSKVRRWPRGWQEALEKGAVTALTVVERYPEGRVSRVAAVVQLGQTKLELVVPGVVFREWLGNTKVRSTLLEIGASGKGWVIHGRGNGHGVGLCQWGAKVMAERGYGMNAILMHYYPDTVLKKMW